MTYKMIDISSNNHADDAAINFAAVAREEVTKVIIKATQGVEYVNPWLEKDAHGARAAGLDVGYYHFADPSQATAQEQAAYFQGKTQGLPRDLGLWLDLEMSGGKSWDELSQWGKDFLDYLSDNVVIKGVYLNTDWLDHLPQCPWGHKLWLASWGTRPRRQVWAWQLGQSTIGGTPGLTDIDVFYG